MDDRFATALDHVVDRAATDGLAAGLRSVLDPDRPVPCTPGGYTFLPAGCAAGLDAAGLDAVVLPHPLAAAEGLELIRLNDPTGSGRAEPAYARALAAVRLGLLRRMLDLALDHLAGRQSDGAPLTARQLVQGAIAEVATTLETGRHALRAGSDPAPTGWLHDRIDEAGLIVTGLFGAAGYLREHPARCLHVAALVRAAWVPDESID